MAKQSDPRRQRFEALFDEHAQPLMALVRRLARNDHDAEDAFQETAMRVWKHIDRAPRLRNPRGWLMTIGYRAFLDLRSSRPKPGSLAAAEEVPDDVQPTPEESAQRTESTERVQATVAGLPESLRRVVLLHYTGGLSLRETASALGVPVGTVKSRLNQALGQLRKAIE